MVLIPDKNLLSLLILAGGKSSRMGCDKSKLPWRGTTSLTSLLQRSIVFPFKNTIISINRELDLSDLPGTVVATTGKRRESDIEYTWTLPDGTKRTVFVVADTFTERGPLGGMEAAMHMHKTTKWLVLSVDLPFYDFSAVNRLLSAHMTKDADAVIPLVNGKEEPLSAIYSGRIYKKILTALAAGNYRVRHIYADKKVVYIDESAHARQYVNMNTPVAYKEALSYDTNSMRKVPLFSICAASSGAGKTRLVTALIGQLTREGYSVGYVKSTHHRIYGNKEGSDTDLAKKAGAKETRIVPSVDSKAADKRNLLAAAAEEMDVDVVFIETRDHAVFPTIRILGSTEIIPARHNAKQILAVISRQFPEKCDYIRRFEVNNIQPLYKYIKRFMHVRH